MANKQFWIDNTVYKVAVYNIHDVSKSMTSHLCDKKYKRI